uniref:Uncharacterized mitochondrial protein AtMg00810-like n=1 Tax=Nicotiana tabacum TaxID=4097 RepID=A0A1S3XAS1_TOBAC|nr:PREDICTED: uncharacterized mitochondrial protein AtMg00810-like [Nicotiana tabacum]
MAGCHKARLVVRGDTQVEGVDFQETFSHVIKISTVKTLVVVDIKQHRPLFQLDVNNAFLHGDLDKEVFIRPLGNGIPSYLKPCILEDILILSMIIPCLPGYFLDDQFKIKDLGSLNYFLGIDVLHTTSGVLLHQRKFILDLLAEFHSDACSPITCPLELNVKLKDRVGNYLPMPEEYRSLISKLNFFTHTRHDLNFVVQHLSQFMQQPCEPQMKVALHLLRYLRGTSDFGIFFNNSSDLSLQVYCDSDWGSCPESRRSVYGFCIFLGRSLISWKSKKHVVISLSLAETEYMAMSKVVAKTIWVCRLLTDFGFPSALHILHFCDSMSAIHNARNPVFHERTNYFELDCHFVRSKLAEGLISLSHTSSASQLAC